jgi:hypothetical protein
MPAEIGLSDGTKLRVDMSANEVMDGLREMAQDYEGGTTPTYGDWQMIAPESGVYFNPAHVVYVKDVQEATTPQVAWR